MKYEFNLVILTETIELFLNSYITYAPRKSLSVSDDVFLTIIDVDNDDFQMYMKCHKTNALLFE